MIFDGLLSHKPLEKGEEYRMILNDKKNGEIYARIGDAFVYVTNAGDDQIGDLVYAKITEKEDKETLYAELTEDIREEEEIVDVSDEEEE